MEENKTIENKIENLPLKETEKSYTLENLPEDQADKIPRDATGKIQVEAIATGKDDKGYIIPDNIFDKYLKELPEGTTNQSGTFRAYNGGKLARLENNREEASKRGLAGAISSNTAQAARRTFAEVIEEMLVKPANAQMIEDLELTTGATNLDVIIAAALKQASRGNVKAADFLRDTIGQKPSEKVDASITGLSPEDKQMLQNISNRIGLETQDID